MALDELLGYARRIYRRAASVKPEESLVLARTSADMCSAFHFRRRRYMFGSLSSPSEVKKNCLRKRLTNLIQQ